MRGQDLVGEELSQTRVVDACDLMEEAGPVHSALGHQEMPKRVEIYPFAKCLMAAIAPAITSLPATTPK